MNLIWSLQEERDSTVILNRHLQMKGISVLILQRATFGIHYRKLQFAAN